MRQPDHHPGEDPRVAQARHGRTRTLPTVIAVAGVASLLGASALLGITPGADETVAAAPSTTPTTPLATTSTPTTSSLPTPAGTPSQDAPAEPPTTAPLNAAPAHGSAAPPAQAGPPPAQVAPAASQLPPAAAPVHLTVPAAGIDQPVIPLTPTAENLAEQSIVPPLTTDAYWLTSYGHPGAGSQNTTYITGHSWEGLDAPFDRLSTQVAPGDTVVIGTGTGEVVYVVDSVTTYDKTTLKDSEIWNIVPNRLVLISCFTQDPWGKNVVVTATPAL